MQTVRPPQLEILHTDLKAVATPKITGFLDLPAEVRVDIYRHLFRDAVLALEPAFPALSHCGYSICRCQFPHAVVSTCRTIRLEAVAYLLASTTLSLASTSHKLDLLPAYYLSAIPRARVFSIGQYLKRPINFDRFPALETLELHNIAVWCRYHSAEDLAGEDGEQIMLSLAMFNIKRHGPDLALLCASSDRRFNILLHCRFVISRQETLVSNPFTLHCKQN